jgi:hypothetical protein
MNKYKNIDIFEEEDWDEVEIDTDSFFLLVKTKISRSKYLEKYNFNKLCL